MIILNKWFENIYPKELQLNKTNTFETEAPFLDVNYSISDDMHSTKINGNLDDFYFDIVNFPFLDGDDLMSHPVVYIFLS